MGLGCLRMHLAGGLGAAEVSPVPLTISAGGRSSMCLIIVWEQAYPRGDALAFGLCTTHDQLVISKARVTSP